MKKLISWIAIFFVLAPNLPIEIVFGDLEVNTFKIKNLDAGSYALNPGDTFSVDMHAYNTLSGAISNVVAKLSFGNNAGFSYTGNDERTRINGEVVTNPIPVSAYDTSAGFSYPITDATHTQIPGGVLFDMSRASNGYVGFSVSPNITTYENSITAGFEAQAEDGAPLIGETVSRVIYANVKPHVTDYYFEKADASSPTNQVQGDRAEMVNFVANVKDYNGCANIGSGTVTANLSALGLSDEEALSYVSCGSDGKTALFKKTGITTTADLGDKTIDSDTVLAKDVDGNKNDPSDPYFSKEDKKAPYVLTIVPPAAPTVVIGSVSNLFVGGPSKQTATVSFSGSQTGETKVTIGGDGNCASGAILQDWSASGSYTAYDTATIDIPAASLADGTNTIFVCERNSAGKIGNASVVLSKDVVAPTISHLAITPASVILNDSKVSYRCDEDGTYQVELGGSSLGGGTLIGSGNVAAGVAVNQTVANGVLANGVNPIAMYCIDKAANLSSMSGSISKAPPTPSMAGMTVTLADNDIDYDGLDGRDFSVTWATNPANGFNYFESYRVFILPSTASFDSANQQFTGVATDSASGTWTGMASVKKDALGNALVSGEYYKACVAIMGTSGMLGGEACSAPALVTADVVAHPIVNSARFTSDTNLELTTNATLDTNLSTQSGALVAVTVGGVTFSGTNVSSVKGSIINVTIPSLGGNLAATGNDLLVS